MHTRDYLDHILALLGLSYKVFRPLVEVLQSPTSPLALKDWPLAFLADAHRAGELYSTPKDITEDLVLLWIGRAKEVLSGSDFDLSPNYLQHINQCRRHPQIMHELGTLDLSKLCCHVNRGDEEFHCYAHRQLFRPFIFGDVQNWLRQHPDTPLETIVLWEQQWVNIQ
ncbi:hypothetical protein DFH08DRAFT_219685 [Mycena albidolilacea]|uniref:Uncharacterized protein n=1 Tax=Mycena albidolilacea TaxID=1033008 RepID=A0AAD6ZWZ4_9AGAR|nr:hypothetical protein DFH08DRAFT_219685 [Mycena albidolilacea]